MDSGRRPRQRELKNCEGQRGDMHFGQSEPLCQLRSRWSVVWDYIYEYRTRRTLRSLEHPWLAQYLAQLGNLRALTKAHGFEMSSSKSTSAFLI